MDPLAAALVGSLDRQRSHVLGILEGLDADQLRHPVLPTGWNCVGLVNHLALDVEHFWFQTVMAGRSDEADESEEMSAWQVSAGADPEEIFARYRRAIAAANQVVAATPLDRPPAYWPENQFGSFRLANLQAILLHVITETACHAGHLDAARELLDGTTWSVL